MTEIRRETLLSIVGVLFAAAVVGVLTLGPAISGLIFPSIGANRLYLYVFTAGALVGLSELLTRHRDYPLLAAVSVLSLLYLILNGALSVLALLIVNLSPPEFLKEGDHLEPLKTFLFVGFGAAAFFRSSFFKVRTADGDISVGPGLMIDVFLRVIDDLVDRSLGVKRLKDVSEIMTGVSYKKAAKALPAYCFAALRRLSPEAQQQFAIQVKALTDAADIEEDTKPVPLGLAIMALTGLPILTNAVEQLAKTIKNNPPSAAAQQSAASPTPPAPFGRRNNFDHAIAGGRWCHAVASQTISQHKNRFRDGAYTRR